MMIVNIMMSMMTTMTMMTMMTMITMMIMIITMMMSTMIMMIMTMMTGNRPTYVLLKNVRIRVNVKTIISKGTINASLTLQFKTIGTS